MAGNTGRTGRRTQSGWLNDTMTGLPAVWKYVQPWAVNPSEILTYLTFAVIPIWWRKATGPSFRQQASAQFPQQVQRRHWGSATISGFNLHKVPLNTEEGYLMVFLHVRLLPPVPPTPSAPWLSRRRELEPVTQWLDSPHIFFHIFQDFQEVCKQIDFITVTAHYMKTSYKNRNYNNKHNNGIKTEEENWNIPLKADISI